MGHVILDSGALTLLADRDPRVEALLRRLLGDDGAVWVPTVCLVESLTGSSRDARLNRRLKHVLAHPLDERLAREAAVRRAAVAGDDAADPVVAANAAALGATILTTDPDDLRALAAVVGPHPPVIDPRTIG